MSIITIRCDEVTVTNARNTRHEVDVCVDGIDEDQVLDELGNAYIADYAATNCLDEVIGNSDIAEVLSQYSWDEVKSHFNAEIIDDLCGLEDQVMNELGWGTICSHFQDEIDAKASEIAQDLVERGVE